MAMSAMIRERVAMSAPAAMQERVSNPVQLSRDAKREKNYKHTSLLLIAGVVNSSNIITVLVA